MIVVWMVDIVRIVIDVVVIVVVGVVVVVITGFWVVVAMAVLFLQYVRLPRLPGSHCMNNESQTHTIRLTHMHSTHTCAYWHAYMRARTRQASCVIPASHTLAPNRPPHHSPLHVID